MGLFQFHLVQKLSQGFSAFWVRWPRKVAKLEAQKAWTAVVTPDDEAPIHQALDWQLSVFAQRQPEHIPHAATWIRGRRWEDEPPTTTPSRPIVKPPVVILKPQTTMAEQQMDARNRIHSLVQAGMDPEQAKDEVYRAMGWRK